ncbi:MAG: type II toxin-antitoxin system RelE/ParE family toxin [Bacteroidetes bacterium]|nr:type II toxin-antitoxin system RelE/ParE family toxin [Bacteroidota bacterium]
MNPYRVTLSKTAQKQLDKLPDNVALPIIKTIKKLSLNPRPHGYKKLKGRDAFRVRQGNYRIIYEIHDQILLVAVIAIGHRKNIYE